MVDLGTRSCLDHVPAGPCGSVRAGAAGWRRDGHRAPGPPRVWPGPASRGGPLAPQLARLSLGADGGRRVGAREAAVGDTPLGPPQLGGVGPAPPEGEAGQGARQPPPAHLARRRLARLRRGVPARPGLFVGDRGEGTSATARCCPQHRQPLTSGRTCDGEAAVYEPPPPRPTLGRPRVKGQPRPAPRAGVAPTATRPHRTVAWEGGTTRDLAAVTGTGHWYRSGADLVAVRWGDVPDGTGPPRAASVLTTARTMTPHHRGPRYTPRWAMATTCQACREPLKRDATTRDGQRTGLRCTPWWFGRDTLVVLLAWQLPPPFHRLRPVRWRGTSTVPLSDLLMGGRHALGQPGCFHTQAHAPECATRSPS